VALASVRDKLGNGATYGGEILHADPGRACVTYGLGLISIGVVIWKKIVLLKQRFLALQRAAATGWRACPAVIGRGSSSSQATAASVASFEKQLACIAG